MSCPDCFKGVEHEGTPTGTVQRLHERNVYVAEPSNGAAPKAIIIIVPDAFGWEFPNNRLLADHYAEQGGFLVYLPDFMDDRPAPTWLIEPVASLTDDNTLYDWLWKPWLVVKVARGVIPFFLYNSFGKAWPRIRSFFEAVRTAEGAELPIAAAGFCWGGKPVLTLAKKDQLTAAGKPLVDVVFTGHPSGLSIPDDVTDLAKPVSIAIGDGDKVTPMKQVQAIKERWRQTPELPTEVVIYAGAGHGFCVRVDIRNKKQHQQSIDAEKQAVDWIKAHTG